MSVISELVTATEKTLEELRAKIAAESGQALDKLFKAFFDAYPEVKTIYWAQYTPYFNDGDPCTFTLTDINFSPLDHDNIEGPYDEPDGDDASFSSYGDDRASAQMLADMKAVSRFLENIEAHLEATYEDHTFVKVHRGGVVTDEYSHE